MAGVTYFIILCVIGIVSAQDELGSGTDGFCYVGQGDTYESIETATRECQFLENACQVKVEISPVGMRIFGECKELTACQNNAATSKCYNQLFTRAQSAEMVHLAGDCGRWACIMMVTPINDERDHVCHYCCQGGLCNTASFARDQVTADQDALLFK